jgi:DNA-binding NtrC family response regulator
MPATILLIEDDPSLASALKKVLEAESYRVVASSRGDQGLELARQETWDLIISDLRLPGLSGMDLIAQLHAVQPRVPIIVMTAHGTTETAIEATKLGAFEYLVKPFEPDELLDMISSGVSRARLMSEPVVLGEEPSAQHAIVGSSRVMQKIYKEIGRIAATPVTVLIRGATGTGKELIARAIYQHSDRAHKPFIAVNCAAIPETLLESELFGHERGSFTGAHSRRIGRFEQAQGGTIFLDEIGDLSPGTQAKLLRVLQEKHIQRVGGNELLPVDARILAATHLDLESALQEKEFREDLYYRLSVVTIGLPPLKDRTEDIPGLARFFIRRYAKDLGVEDPSIQSDAIAWLQHQSWPGNVRELENVVRQTLLAARPFGISLDHVKQVVAKTRKAPVPANQPHALYISELLSRVERGEIEGAYDKMIADLEPELFAQAIHMAHGNQAKAARWLGVTRLKMRGKLTQLGLHPHRETFLAPPYPGKDSINHAI